MWSNRLLRYLQITPLDTGISKDISYSLTWLHVYHLYLQAIAGYQDPFIIILTPLYIRYISIFPRRSIPISTGSQIHAHLSDDKEGENLVVDSNDDFTSSVTEMITAPSFSLSYPYLYSPIWGYIILSLLFGDAIIGASWSVSAERNYKYSYICEQYILKIWVGSHFEKPSKDLLRISRACTIYSISLFLRPR
jgi:hypothetical protein